MYSGSIPDVASSLSPSREALISRLMDYAQARAAMVDCQVRTVDVTHAALIAAMRAAPREAFVPPALKDLAYADCELEVAPGRHLLRPRDLAKLIQALAPAPGDKCLEIGGATGYGATLLANLAGAAVSLEPDSNLLPAMRAALEAAGATTVTPVATAAAQGWPDAAPYDVILVNGSVEIVPEAWLGQLAPGGRLAVIVRIGPAGAARLYTKADGVVSHRIVFDAAPPLLLGLARPPAFTF